MEQIYGPSCPSFAAHRVIVQTGSPQQHRDSQQKSWTWLSISKWLRGRLGGVERKPTKTGFMSVELYQYPVAAPYYPRWVSLLPSRGPLFSVMQRHLLFALQTSLLNRFYLCRICTKANSNSPVEVQAQSRTVHRVSCNTRKKKKCDCILLGACRNSQQIPRQ